MTIKLMAKFGVVVENEGDKVFTVKAGQKYVSPGTIFVEGDASSVGASWELGSRGWDRHQGGGGRFRVVALLVRHDVRP